MKQAGKIPGGDGRNGMKDLTLVVWLTQLGISVAGPLVGFVLLAVWLRNSFDLGSWVIWAGAAVGAVCAVDGLRESLRLMSRISKRKKEDKQPPVAFNDHE